MSSPRPVRRILMVRPSALGDVCRTVPVLASLREAHPTARIDWIVQDTFAPAVSGHPSLDHVVEFPRGSLSSWWRNPLATARAAHWLLSLRQAQYDLVFDCQGLSRSGIMTRATGAPRRVGYRGTKEFAWLGYNVRHGDPASSGPGRRPVHTVDRMLQLLELEGIQPVRDMRLYVAEHDQRWWRTARARAHWGESAYAVLAPTSRWPSKRWPIERWRALIRPLLERGLRRFAVIGSPAERDQIEPLVRADESTRNCTLDLVGLTSIAQTMAVIEQASLVIANDSAPLHMAVGFERPCIGLFGPTDPEVVGPYQRPEAVLQKCSFQPGEAINFRSRALGDRLMRAIEVEDVVQKADAILESAAAQAQTTVLVARGRAAAWVAGAAPVAPSHVVGKVRP